MLFDVVHIPYLLNYLVKATSLDIGWQSKLIAWSNHDYLIKLGSLCSKYHLAEDKFWKVPRFSLESFIIKPRLGLMQFQWKGSGCAAICWEVARYSCVPQLKLVANGAECHDACCSSGYASQKSWPELQGVACAPSTTWRCSWVAKQRLG